jgi:hypothetical protein
MDCSGLTEKNQMQCPGIAPPVATFTTSPVTLLPEQLVNAVALFTAPTTLARLPSPEALNAYFQNASVSFTFRAFSGPSTNLTLGLVGMNTFTGASEIKLPPNGNKEVVFSYSRLAWTVLA